MILIKENQSLRERLDEDSSISNIIGKSPPMHELLDMVKTVAATEATILISGKAAPARNRSPRPSTPTATARNKTSSPLTARRSPTPCWNRNSSAMKKELLQGRTNAETGVLCRPTAAQFFSMKWEKSPCPCRPNCYGPFKNGKFNGWGATSFSR